MSSDQKRQSVVRRWHQGIDSFSPQKRKIIFVDLDKVGKPLHAAFHDGDDPLAARAASPHRLSSASIPPQNELMELRGHPPHQFKIWEYTDPEWPSFTAQRGSKIHQFPSNDYATA
jgi:hypothetical protein